MFHLLLNREPFSDWFARFERAIERRMGFRHGQVHLPDRAPFKSLYFCGISPLEAADDFVSEYERDWKRA